MPNHWKKDDREVTSLRIASCLADSSSTDAALSLSEWCSSRSCASIVMLQDRCRSLARHAIIGCNIHELWWCRTYELSSRTHAAGKWALVLSGVALVLLGMVLLGMVSCHPLASERSERSERSVCMQTSSQPRSMPAVISVALPANWNTVASRFQV